MTLQQIDNLCDEFEAALRRGDTLRIEDFLPKADEEEQNVLLKELLEIEIQFTLEHQPSDDSLRNTQESLLKRFPEQRDFIKSLFRRLTELRQIGDYEILGELGRGGMGVVYKAKHKLLQQTVAIKVLSQALLDDPQAVGRFRREMQLIGGLTHPNVVRALNAGEINGTHYLAMEFVDGITLQKLVEHERIKKDKTTGSVGSPLLPLIPLGAACEAIRQAALGLQNAHELKLVHRDIKPANLMLDYRGTVKILDLGLGKFVEERRNDYHSSLTVPGMVIGTVDYISPEQCENSGEADIRSDLYSLGCSLFFLLTGKPVYSGSRYDTMRKKMMAHIVGEVPSLRQVIPNLPNEIEAILQKVLAKEPAERFQTPIEFAEALVPFASPDELWTLVQDVVPEGLQGHSSSSRYSNFPYSLAQPSKQYVSALPARRAKWIAFLVGLNLLLFGLGIGAALYFFAPRLSETQQTLQLDTMLKEAEQAEEKAVALRKQWKMAEAHAEYQKAVTILAEMYLRTRHSNVLKLLFINQMESAVTQWYHGDSRTAGRSLDTLLTSIDNIKEEETKSEFTFLKTLVQERRADFTLFGGAASGTNAERFSDRIFRYGEAARTTADNPRNREIRWKQAILCSLQGDLEEAEKLLRENSALSKEPEMYYRLVRELAEAVVFYQRAVERAPDLLSDRDQKLRAFQSQFTLQSNALREPAMQPEILELLMFCGELLLNDSIKHEDWKVLADDFTAINNASASFLRQNPGATPFLRRFNELLVRSAVLLHHNAEQQRDKQRHLGSIARLLERMRLPANEGAEGEKPTHIYFFLPETNKAEEGFVLFYPQDGREGGVYPLPLTRQMVKQGQRVPPLDTKLLEQTKPERRMRISWDDSASWSRTEDALTEKDYPYGNVLPLQ